MKKKLLYLCLALVLSSSCSKPASPFSSRGRLDSQTFFSNDNSFIPFSSRREPATRQNSLHRILVTEPKSLNFYRNEPGTRNNFLRESGNRAPAIFSFSHGKSSNFSRLVPKTPRISNDKALVKNYNSFIPSFSRREPVTRQNSFNRIPVTPTFVIRPLSRGEPDTRNFLPKSRDPATRKNYLDESRTRAPATFTFSHGESSNFPRPEPQTPSISYDKTPVKMFDNYYNTDGLGNYEYGFIQPDDTFRWEKGELKYYEGKPYVYKTGGYGFIGDDNKLHGSNYTAGVNGYEPVPGPPGCPIRLGQSACG